MAAVADLWSVGGASVIGAAHERKGLPNQDGVRWVPENGSAQRAILAVADGHGSAPHFRSAVGSQLAVRAAVDVLDWAFDAPDVGGAAADLPHELVACWRGLVLEHEAAAPFEAARTERDVFTAYGTTCIAAAIAEDRLLLCQIGDGDVLLGLPDGTVVHPLPADRLPGEQTYSLCLEDAARYARVRVLRRDADAVWPDFAMLATDGVAKSFPDDATFEEVGRSYRRLALEDFAATLGGLPDWLADVTRRGSGDDVSMCLAARRAGT